MGLSSKPAVLVLEQHSAVADALVVALRAADLGGAAALKPDVIDLRTVEEVAHGFDVVLAGLREGEGKTVLPLVRTLVGGGWKVLVVTTDQGTALAGHALRAGAEAVVHQDMHFDRLVATIQAVHAGQRLLTDEERAALLEHLPADDSRDRWASGFGDLTASEARTLRHLIEGRSPKVVAAVEHVTIHAVRKHIRGVLAKLEVGSQREALALARRVGWPWDNEPPAS